MVLSSFKFNFAKVVSLIGNLKANVACSYVTVVNSFKGLYQVGWKKAYFNQKWF